MSYSTSNPPKLLVPSMGSGQPALWIYASGDAHTDVDATDYFSNGKDIGMKVGDVVLVQNTGSSAYTMTTHAVSAIDADGNATVSAAVLA